MENDNITTAECFGDEACPHEKFTLNACFKCVFKYVCHGLDFPEVEACQKLSTSEKDSAD